MHPMLSTFGDDVVSVTNLRRDLPAMLERVRGGVPVTIMQGDRADLAIIKRTDVAALSGEVQTLRKQLADLAGELETLEILSDQRLMASIRAGVHDLEEGRTIALADLDEYD